MKMATNMVLVSSYKNRWLVVSFLVTALLLLILLGNLVHKRQTLESLEETHLSLEHAASELPFHIQGMQTSVRLAAESGDLTWRDRHEEHRKGAESTLKRIEEIKKSQPTVMDAADRLQARLEESDAFYWKAFQRLIQGKKEEAKSILGSWPYIRNRNALRQDSKEVGNLLQEDVRQRLARQQRFVAWTVAGGLLLSLVTLASWIVAVHHWRLNVRQRQKREADILYLSNHDSLTGLPNRRRFFEQGEAEINRTRRHGSSLAVLMLDIDHFKKINDTFSHSAGDHVLMRFSKTIASELRDIDLPGRLGGEEFAVLLPETSSSAAVQVAERLRQAIADMDIDYEGRAIPVTVSIGVTSTESGEAGLDALLAAADDALYRAKTAGRNRVVDGSDT